jgi:hypothetical protein
MSIHADTQACSSDQFTQKLHFSPLSPDISDNGLSAPLAAGRFP